MRIGGSPGELNIGANKGYNVNEFLSRYYKPHWRTTNQEWHQLLHRAKPDERVSVTSLHRIYIAAGVKRKVIVKAKRVPKKSQSWSNEAVRYC